MLMYVDKTVFQKALSAELSGSGKTEQTSFDFTGTEKSFCVPVPLPSLKFPTYERIVVREPSPRPLLIQDKGQQL